MADHSALLCDPAEKASLEAENGVEQLDYISYLVTQGTVDEIRESYLLEFHKLAVQGIYPCAGNYRTAAQHIEIRGSQHQVPEAAFVRELVLSLIDQLNRERDHVPAMERAAYALWRLNWIHPFAGGNGRTARALAYLVLCLDLKLVPPGPQMPRLIFERRAEYDEALKVADRCDQESGKPDLEPMKSLIEDVVTQQLAAVIDRLRGT